MNETRKWILHRISAVILAPLYAWLYISLISISVKGYSEAIYFLKDPLFVIITIIVFFVGFFHVKISLSEIFEDYIQNKKNKDVANLLTSIFSIIIPIIILILLTYKIYSSSIFFSLFVNQNKKIGVIWKKWANKN